jgi:hypothetical protein
VFLAQPLSFGVLISLYLCGPQFVSALCSVAIFCVLTSLPICGLQGVSAPRSVALFLCSYKSLSLRFPGSECPSRVCVLSFLTGLFLDTPQFVSAPLMLLFGLLICSLRSQKVSFSVVFSIFRCSHLFFPGAAVSILQTGIVLLQCTVIIFLFYFDFTNRRSASSLYI